jgi:hypothetical protein
MPDLIVRIESSGGRRYAITDRNGEFAIDGLTESEYTVSLLDEDFPEKERLLNGPLRFTMPARGCVSQELYVPKAAVRNR